MVSRRGRPERELADLVRSVGADTVHVTQDVSPYARRRGERVARALREAGAELRSHEGLNAVDVRTIETQQGIQQRLSPVTERIRATTAVERPLAARKKPVAVVVGGGLAGLMASRTLAAQFEVTLFEARDRMGGRVKSLRDESTKRIIEAGGVFEYARKVGMLKG